MKKFVMALMIVFLVSCGGGSSKGNKVIVYSPHPLEFIEPIRTAFTEDTGIEVEVIAAGTGELLKRVEAESNRPLGDILWGGTISTVSRNVNLFENHKSTNEAAILDAFKNVEGNQTRFTTVPSVIMVNTNLTAGIEIKGYEDLLNPALKGKIAFADPSLSSSSFEHLVNMLYAMGDGDPEKGWDYVALLMDNLEGKILGGSSAVYKGVADGEYAVGLTFEEGALNYVGNDSPVQVVYMEEGVISKADGIYIIKGGPNPDNAKAFVDYTTSPKVQGMVEDLNRRTIRSDIKSKGKIKSFSDINMIFDDPAVVAEQKQAWLDKFKEVYVNYSK